MAVFRVNVPVTTSEPRVSVDAGLPVGRHRFRLVAVDTAGLRSSPHEAIVTVQQVIGPGPIVVNPGPIVVNPGPIVPGPIVPGPITPTPVIRSRPAGTTGVRTTTRRRRRKEEPS